MLIYTDYCTLILECISSKQIAGWCKKL